jgi:hypothetical protein
MFKLLRWIQNLNQSTWDLEILYADRASKDGKTFSKIIFVKKLKVWTWRTDESLNNILFYGENF